MSEDGIRCVCTHRITAGEITQHGFVMVQWQPVFVYLKYRCAECFQVGEELVACEDWDPALLAEEPDLAEQEVCDSDAIMFIQQLRTVVELDWEELREIT